jgi:hypothetical protein
MFNNLPKINYSFDGIEREIVIFNNDFDLSEMSSSFYAEKLNLDELLDSFSYRLFENSNYYYIPLYSGNILNPLIELPPSSEELEVNFDDFKSITSQISSFNVDGISGTTGNFLLPNDLILGVCSGISSGYDITNNYGYVIDVDYAVDKLKVLIKGSLSSSSAYRVLRNTDGKWNRIAQTYLLSQPQTSDYGGSPIRFVNEYGIILYDTKDVGYASGTPTGGYITVSEQNDFVGDKNIINIPTKSDIKIVGDMINGSS